MTEELLVERRGGVTWVTLNRPEVRNALTPDMRNRLIDVVEEVGSDPEQRCLVITVVPRDELEKATTEWAERLARGPTKALGLAKRLLNRSLEQTVDQSLA